ncbi:MAG: threonine synthase [Gracilibacteraceae bacterium]|jgi:threonine synthase|nr:threonine synthase [Gracilibacteraceae bacterium]
MPDNIASHPLKKEITPPSCESTRGLAAPLGTAAAVTAGIAPDGGLYVPRSLPLLPWREWLDLDYSAVAARVVRLLAPDLPEAGVAAAAAVYGDGRFGPGSPAPLIEAGALGVLELWHGPTAAFKDMALQALPHLLTAAAAQVAAGREILILTATSGDTGKAALEGFRDVPGASVCVFYPDGGVSAVQEKQMLTTGGNNTFVAAVRGNFDVCQQAVKTAFTTEWLREALAERGVLFSSANSINWGRLLPQIVYYIWSYLEAVRQNRVKAGAPVNFAVPTGNFGNILAGWYARSMGLPVGRLLCASNRNNVLADFFRDGVYDVNREFFRTESPSMDILVSSNFERLLFELGGRDGEKIRRLYADLQEKSRFQVEESVLKACQAVFAGGWTDEDACRAVIRRVWREWRYLLDPHTAIAWGMAEDYRAASGDETYTIVVSTASPFKFAPAVLAALTETAPAEPWAALAELEQVTGWPAPQALRGLDTKKERREALLAPEEIAAWVSGKFAPPF